MAIVNDPTNLSQGTSTVIADLTFGAPTGSQATITSAGSSIPTISAGAYFEIRGANDPENNGLWKEDGGSPSNGSVTASKVAGDNGATPVTGTGAGGTMLHTEASLADEKTVYFDVYNREIWLIPDQGNLTDAGGATDNGVLMQTLYSFAKEEWKADAELYPHPFPFVAITPEQFEMVSNWTFQDTAVNGTTARKLVRTGGWREIDVNDQLQQEYAGVITLGTFADAADRAYFRQGDDNTDTAAGVDFTFADQVNEAVRSWYYVTNESTDDTGQVEFTATNEVTRTTGSWSTEGYKVGGQISIVTSDTVAHLDSDANASGTGPFTITLANTTHLQVSGTPFTTGVDSTFSSAVNDRNVLTLFLREQGKTYDQATLTDIGVSAVDNKVFRFPLTNGSDTKISAADGTITSNSPWNEIQIRYFGSAFTRDVTASSDFGIVIDVGTLSGVDGSTTSGTGNFSTTAGGITTAYAAGTFTGGKLVIHSGVEAGEYTISSITDDNNIVVTPTFGSTISGTVDFTIERATPVTANTAAGTTLNQQIYERVQYELRQTADIDDTAGTNGVIVGKTADQLLSFIGDQLNAGETDTSAPKNYQGGGTGVAIEGFDPNDSNDLRFFDNGGTARTFPRIAAGTITFNTNLTTDADAEFWMFYRHTTRTVPTNGISIATTGTTSTISCTTGAQDLPVVVANQYIGLEGMDNPENNGVYRVLASPSPTTTSFAARKLDQTPAPIDEGATASAAVTENPINSPDALLVANNTGGNITATVPSGGTYVWDYAYTTNAQGERVAAQGDANVVIRAIGLTTGAFVEQNFTIADATGQVFGVVAALERNYSNP